MSKRLLSLLLASSLAVAACDRDTPSETADTTASETSPAPTGIPFGSEDHLSMEQAQALGTTWANALNERDWPQLNKLFTDETVIVTRDGAMVNRVAPSVWKSQMAASKELDPFKLELKEEFTHAKLPSGAMLRSSAEVVGEQQGNYSGTWDLLVRDIEGNARVVGLFERVQRAKGESAPNRHLGSIVTADGVLLEAQPTEFHERGTRTLIEPAGLAELWVEESKLPVEWQRFKGKSFEIVDASGKSCRSEVAGFRYYSRTSVPTWLGDAWANQSSSKQGARDAGEAAWKMGAIGGHSLVAKLTPDPRIDCPNPVFVRMQGAGGYSVYNQSEEMRISSEEIAQQVERMEAAQQLGAFVESRGGTAESIFSESVEVRQFVSETRQFVSFTVTDNRKCNELAATMFFIWEVTGGNWVLLNDPASSRYPFVPEYAADANNDGSPEFYGTDMVVRESGGTFKVVEDVRPIDFMGGC